MKTADQVMFKLWRQYVSGDVESFDRVSLRNFRREGETSAENDAPVSGGKVYAIEEVAFLGEE